MFRRLFIVLHAASAFFVASSAAEAARAQGAGGPRFRGGVGIEVSPILGSGSSLGDGGIQGQLGVQINFNWAVYAVPSVGVAGTVGYGTLGVAGSALVADYTFDDVPFAVGAGVDGDVLFSDVPRGGLYGGRLRGVWYPWARGGPSRNQAIFVALDVRLLGLRLPQPGLMAGTSEGPFFVVSPVASFGYQVF